MSQRTIIVVPCYNEAARLDTAAFRSYAHDAGSGTTSFLFVNDGSTDDTLAVLQQLARDLGPDHGVLDLQPNGWKAEAVRRGVLHSLAASPGIVGFWDADLATPLATIDSFQDILGQQPDIEMVFGARVQLLGRAIHRHHRRHYAGRLFATTVSIVLDLPIYDTQCGAKLFRVGPMTPELFADPFLSRWVFDVEIIARQMRAHRRHRGRDAAEIIFEYPLERWTDVPGSKLSMSDFVRSMFDVLKIWHAYR